MIKESKKQDHTVPPTILGHIDTLFSLDRQNRTFGEESERGVCDYPRMRRHKVVAALFAVYPCQSGYQLRTGLDHWFHHINDPKNNLTQIRAVEDLESVQKTDKIGAILHAEGAGGFDTEFASLRLAAQLGLRTLGITWANTNHFGAGYIFRGEQIETGLTAEGRALVHEAQRLGITIDVSHLNDLSFWDVMEEAERPIMASHSNARKICQIGRNLTEEQIQAIQANHGVIGLNFGAMFLDPHLDAAKLDEMDSNFGVEVIKQHLDHIVEIADVDSVAFGTDFDGTRLPTCMDSLEKMESFYGYLLDGGYSPQDLHKIAYDNFYRLFKATWK